MQTKQKYLLLRCFTPGAKFFIMSESMNFKLSSTSVFNIFYLMMFVLFSHPANDVLFAFAWCFFSINCFSSGWSQFVSLNNIEIIMNEKEIGIRALENKMHSGKHLSSLKSSSPMMLVPVPGQARSTLLHYQYNHKINVHYHRWPSSIASFLSSASTLNSTSITSNNCHCSNYGCTSSVTCSNIVKHYNVKSPSSSLLPSTASLVNNNKQQHIVFNPLTVIYSNYKNKLRKSFNFVNHNNNNNGQRIVVKTHYQTNSINNGYDNDDDNHKLTNNDNNDDDYCPKQVKQIRIKLNLIK